MISLVPFNEMEAAFPQHLAYGFKLKPGMADNFFTAVGVNAFKAPCHIPG